MNDPSTYLYLSILTHPHMFIPTYLPRQYCAPYGTLLHSLQSLFHPIILLIVQIPYFLLLYLILHLLIPPFTPPALLMLPLFVTPPLVGDIVSAIRTGKSYLKKKDELQAMGFNYLVGVYLMSLLDTSSMSIFSPDHNYSIHIYPIHYLVFSTQPSQLTFSTHLLHPPSPLTLSTHLINPPSPLLTSRLIFYPNTNENTNIPSYVLL